jgi:hypothetical protein
VKFLEAFSNSCESASIPYSDRNYLIQEIAFLSDEDLIILIQSIDESTYSLEEWLEALVFFQKWLQDSKKGKNFTDQIEYISCCIQGSSNAGRLLTLTDLTKSYLDSFGVE